LRFARARFPEELWVAGFAFFTRSMVLQRKFAVYSLFCAGGKLLVTRPPGSPARILPT